AWEDEFATRISLSHRDHFPTLDRKRDHDIRKLLDAELMRSPGLEVRATANREALSRLKRQHGFSTTRRYVSSRVRLQRRVSRQRRRHSSCECHRSFIQ